ncbi:MAG: hypothetical protein V4757_00095 [Pseudomonadota bacterium]
MKITRSPLFQAFAFTLATLAATAALVAAGLADEPGPEHNAACLLCTR